MSFGFVPWAVFLTPALFEIANTILHAPEIVCGLGDNSRSKSIFDRKKRNPAARENSRPRVRERLGVERRPGAQRWSMAT